MMNVKVYKNLFELCENFDKAKYITPSEYVSSIVNIEEDVAYHFINLQRHNAILQDISNHFKSFNKISIDIKMTRLKLLFYILIFAFDPENALEIKRIFTIVSKVSYMIETLLYYSYEQNRIRTSKLASKYFDNDYVIKKFIQPIEEHQETYREIFISIVEIQCKCSKKKNIFPSHKYKSKKILPSVPSNTSAIIVPFHSNRIPRTTYEPDISLRRRLRGAYDKNHEKSLKLLEEVRALPSYQSPVKSKELECCTNVDSSPKPKRIVVKKDVTIKENLTTVMREAALYAKEKESCIKQITDILKGGVDVNITKALEEEARDLEEKRQIEEIERKRLMCLLSHEEAIVAKCKVREENKMKRMKILEEKEELMKHLNEWKDQEKQKYKQYIEKIHECKRNVKLSERKMIEEKQNNARLVYWETKKLIEKAIVQKEKELARKIHIIQEIKAIGQVRAIDVHKEFDRTECPSTGLLCEMSIAELEERLTLIKVEMQTQLEEKRKRIIKRSEQKQKAIEDAKMFIQENRNRREKISLRPPVSKLEESHDIKNLKKKLEEAKQLRLTYNSSPC